MQRDDLDAGTMGVTRHAQDPAGADQAGDGELRAIRLYPARVQLEDLPVTPAVAEVVLRDLPQALVISALRRLDHIDLLGPPYSVVSGLQGLSLAARGPAGPPRRSRPARLSQPAHPGLPGALAGRRGGRRGRPDAPGGRGGGDGRRDPRRLVH